MKLPRREFLHLAASAAAFPSLSHVAWAQSYPVRPVRMIVGFAPGGATDIVARLIGQWLSDRLGKPFVVENRIGAGGNIATEAVARSAADGYTLLVAGQQDAVNASLYAKLNFDFIRDFAPVATLIRQPLVLVVNPSVPVYALPEFIAYAKTNPGKINVASAGNGTPPHLAAELFKMMAAVDIVHIPYRGGAPAITDLLGGRVQALFISELLSIEHVNTGRLRPLAVTAATRLESLPAIPTVGESLAGYETSFWAGVVVPRNTPVEIIDKLNKEINVALSDPKIKTRFAEIGGSVLGGSPTDFQKLLADETEKWRNVIKFAGLKPD